MPYYEACNLLWAYVHIDGTVHRKNFMSWDDLTDAVQSDFVVKIFGPATNEELLKEVKQFMISIEVDGLSKKIQLSVEKEIRRLHECPHV